MRVKAVFQAAAAVALPLAVVAVAQAGSLEPSVVADDGWFEAREIDSRTWALSEPHSSQRNISYFIAGEERAILFDAGSGEGDISFIASRIIDRPVTVLPSHMHFDHIGALADFDDIALPDLPVHRRRMDGETYRPSAAMTLWWPNRDFKVSQWWAPDSDIDLGGRVVRLLHIPGHSSDSIALIDMERGQIFAGDHIYPGPLVAFTPGSDLQAYLSSTRRLRQSFPSAKFLYCAHEEAAMPASALLELEQALSSIIAGRAAGHRVWWLGWLVSDFPFNAFSVLAPPQ